MKLAPAAMTMGAAMLDKESAAQNFKYAAAKMLNPQVAMAEEWGREMARADIEKMASPQFRLRQAYLEMEKDSGVVGSAYKALKGGVQSLGRAAQRGYTGGVGPTLHGPRLDNLTGVKGALHQTKKTFKSLDPAVQAGLVGAAAVPVAGGAGYMLGKD
jgi:hypothetical protein